MAPIPWATTPPDLIEQIVAVLLGNRYSESFRIRASQGDGGLDVLVPVERAGYFDVYQVKKFATNLNNSQKRQIRKSLQRARDTHNDAAKPFLIDRWLLTLPLDPTPEQFQWLAATAEELAVPFPVKWKGFGFLEGLAANYPQVGGYYLRDGKDRLERSITALRDLAQLSASTTGSALEPSDVIDRLGNLRQALNQDDPHYRYDFEVTGNEPVLFERPHLLSSVVFHLPQQYVTFHIYAKYPDAQHDRPIPVSFSIAQASLSPTELAALENALQYGTPVNLPAAAVAEVNVDMPGGLGIAHGTGAIYLGPAHALNDQPMRMVWAVMPPDSTEPIAQLTFEMEVPTRGLSGGMRLHGVDTTGVVALTLQVDSQADGGRPVSLSASVVDPIGKPIAQVLPGLRFLSQFKAPNRLAFGAEYRSLTAVEGLPLSDVQQPVPAIALDFTESLLAISQRSGQVIEFPELGQVDEEAYGNITALGKILRGERMPLAWSAVTARIRPGTSDQEALAGRPLMTSQSFAVTVSGVQHDLGQLYTYLLSARIEGDLDAEPGDDGRIPLTIVPDENNQAVMTNHQLTPEEARQLGPVAAQQG